MSFGGNVIDTPGPDTFQERLYQDAGLSDDEELVEESQDMESEEQVYSESDLVQSAEEGEESEHEASVEDIGTGGHFVDEDIDSANEGSLHDSLHAPSDDPESLYSPSAPS